MSRYSKKKKVSEQTREEAVKMARGTQKPGQTKEQTKLIAQGIQKGIDQYKKQQKSKARELDKKLKQANQPHNGVNESSSLDGQQAIRERPGKLPWILLVLSWVGFALYVAYIQMGINT